MLPFNLLGGGDEDGEREGRSTIKESWMIIEGTPPTTNDAVVLVAVVVAAGVTAAVVSCCLKPTGASDTAHKTKPEPLVQREKMFDHLLTRGVLLSPGFFFSN